MTAVTLAAGTRPITQPITYAGEGACPRRWRRAVAPGAALVALWLVACGEPGDDGRDDTHDDTHDDGRADGLGQDLVNAPDNAAPVAHTHWQTFETTLTRPVTEDNPFDPEVIAVDATFISPDGATFTVPAFAHQDFTRALDEAGDSPRERLTPVGDLVWRVRFRPPMDAPGGLWRWSWRATTPDGVETSPELSFTPTPDTATHGLVRTSPHDPRHLAHEDGAPFVALGENMAWYDARGSFAYDDWLATLSRSGGNFIRVWMPSWAFGLEWSTRGADGTLSARLGDYRDRLDRAWRLDTVLAAARQRGVQVMLTLQNHGPFSTIHASEWDRNPWNAALGGPLAEPSEVFTDASARALFKRRLRYIVARWGHLDNLLAWELWNEVDLVHPPESPEVVAWHREMASELRSRDHHDRLVTTSLGGLEALSALLDDDVASLSTRHAPLWTLEGLDFTQLHFYGLGALQLDFSRDIRRLAPYLARYGRPLLVAEAGVSAASADETLSADPSQAAFIDILWAGLFAGGFGGGMSWWWDTITHPMALERHLAPLATLVHGVAFDREAFVAALDAPTADVTVHSLVGQTTALVWLRDTTHQRWAPSERVLPETTVALTGLAPGRWTASWLDPTVGWTCDEAFPCTPPEGAVPPPERDVDVGADGVVNLTAPTFRQHLALRLVRAR
jgi:hypothetical protein